MKLHLAIVPILVVLVAAYVLFPRATPRSAQVIPSGSLPGAETIPELSGAPLAPLATVQSPSQAPSVAGMDSGSTPGAAPRPSGGIGQPASYCKPGYCEAPKPVVARSHRGIVGTATYYCRPGISRCTVGYPFGMYAAAGPEVRAMLGPDWRGRTVVVIDANGRGVLVQLIDWCACGGDHVIDLYWTAYQGLVNPVTVKENP